MLKHYQNRLMAALLQQPLLAASLFVIALMTAGTVFSGISWLADAPERQRVERVEREKKAIAFCRSVYESITPLDKVCGRYYAVLKQQVDQQKQKERQLHAAERQAYQEQLSRRSSALFDRFSSVGSSGYYRGPRGGCYTYSGSGKKRYVDRSSCN